MASKTIAHVHVDVHTAADRFGAITESYRVALEQIQRLYLNQHHPFKVLDLNVGEGHFLKKLCEILPHSELTGMDVSAELLNRAKETLSLTTIEGSAAQVEHFLPPHSQDLILAHLNHHYSSISSLLTTAQRLTRANGYFSMITTTYDSFPVAQRYLADFITQGSLLSGVVGHYYKSIVRNTTVAANEDELLQAFEKNDFKIVEHQRLRIPIVLNSMEEFAVFGIEGTWFLNNLSIRMLPKQFLLERLKRLFEKIFTFPYQDIHIIDVILAKK